MLSDPMGEQRADLEDKALLFVLTTDVGNEREKNNRDCHVTERMSGKIEVSSNRLEEVCAVGSYIE